MAQKVCQKLAQKVGHEHYSRIPDSVLLDGSLTAAARCVYAFLAGCVHQGTVARVGQRRIGERLGFSRTTVDRAIERLEAGGHLKAVGVGRDRGMYHITSEVFGKKQRAIDAGEDDAEELVSFPRRRLATVRKTA